MAAYMLKKGYTFNDSQRSYDELLNYAQDEGDEILYRFVEVAKPKKKQ